MAKVNVEEPSPKQTPSLPAFPPKAIGNIAEEIAEMVVSRLPYLSKTKKKKPNTQKSKKLDHGIFLDTSAIIDGRIFEVIKLGLFHNVIVVPDHILMELKHIADAQDTVRRERGRRGLEMLEDLKKSKAAKVIVAENRENGKAKTEVDEKLIRLAKANKGKVITCDYNLEKKATIQGVTAINVNALANTLKVTAVPGEALHINVLHLGKDPTQGVGYLDDGTMIVVEQASSELGKTIDVVVSRVIQTSSGRILFAKKIL